MRAIDLPSADDVSRLLERWCAMSPEFAALLAKYGQPAAALRHIGIVQWQSGTLDVAIEAFLAALALAPEDPNLWSDLASIYDGKADTARAEACVMTSLRYDKDRAQSWMVLAGLVDRRGDQEAAERAYQRSIALDPTLAAAHLGLGLVFFKQKKLDRARMSLTASVALDPVNALSQTCLGHILYLEADFAGSAAAFAAAAGLEELDVNARKKQARALTFQAMVEGRTRQALQEYVALAGEHGEDIETISRDAFSLLSAYGHTAAAIEIGRLRLTEHPEDPIRRYLLDAVEGHALTRAPADYVESYFDRFAPEFDQKLVETLRYCAPDVMCGLIGRRRASFSTILDLGCGTGLAAGLLAPMGSQLVGVDLSTGMLEQASKRGAYTRLVKADAVAYLDEDHGQADLIFAADLLIYIGDLGPFFGGVARVLPPGGLFAASLETTTIADFALLPSGRFAHARRYIERLAGADFRIVEQVDELIRLEAGRPIIGLYMIFERL